jgi:hypothetical protein
MAWCFEQGFTFPVTEFFLEDILEKTGYKIKSERDQFPGSSRRKKFKSVTKNDPLSEVFEVSLMVIQSFLCLKMSLEMHNYYVTLILHF